jgi:tRNA A37 methylthiotransferase MiaB
MKKSVFFIHNGCLRRALDVSRLMDYFQLNGCVLAADLGNADYIVFVTCAFIKSKEDECFKIIQNLKGAMGELIILGCLPEIAKAKFRDVFKGSFIATKDLHDIDKIFSEFKIKFADVPDAHFVHKNSYLYEHTHLFFSQWIGNFINKAAYFFDLLIKRIKPAGIKGGKVFRTIKNSLWKKPVYAKSCHLRISSGCLGQCSYCAIRNAIGTLKSKTLQTCIDEYQQLLDKGERRFIIVADDVGAYGLDNKGDFAQLLRRLSLADKNFQVEWFINQLHPKWAIAYKDELLLRIKQKKVLELLCPIQSASRRILRLMRRYEDIDKLEKVLFEFKKARSRVLLYTNIIIGFPSETEDDFMRTINFVIKVKFDYVWMFAYYDSEMAPAHSLSEKIDEKTIRHRITRAKKILDSKGIACVCNNNLRF